MSGIYLRDDPRFADPSLTEPISAALFPSEDGRTAQLLWSRRKPSE